ncbi:hypothetical protein CLPU_6c00580 [Gottschalkia purinilytica]|uniref:Lipoprotein n=1 Tax=Gottschalkia purinilytica TaxID=1503 RepID=A0A0L0WAU8_GOTPU|nr:hypothetical protein [Gottschalkia purinilytica]KNF08572.1 hypothetical protein CLPU_6c00580 [Gottschalkia purinilytica]
MKKLIIVMFSVILIIGVSGCSKNTNTTKDIKEEKQEVNQVQEDKGNLLDQLKDEFKKAGFEIGSNEVVAFDMVNAKNGYKFKVDGELIEIYEYDLNNLSDEAKKSVEQAKKGTVNMSGFNLPCVWNEKGIAMFRVEEHSQKDKIVEIFNNF